MNYYLGNGAQPTPRVVKILTEQKVKLPSWVKTHAGDKKATIKNVEKLRKNRPADETPTEEVPSEAEASTDVEETTETNSEETSKE